MIQDKIKIRGCWYINRNWTIQKQILAISFIISTLIFLILLVIIWTSQSQIQEFLKVTSQEMFMRQTSQQINNIWIQQRGLEQMILQTKQQVVTTRAIYKQLDYLINNSNKSVKFEYPHMCLNNISALDSYCFSSSTTCGIFGEQEPEKEYEETQSLIATTFILTSFRVALDHTFSAPLYYFSDNDLLFFCITAGGLFPNSFKPNERPYYLEFFNFTSQDTAVDRVYFASPYKIIAGYIRIPMITSLVNGNDRIVGMVAKDIDFGYASIAQSKNTNTVLYVIDIEGKIYYSIIYNQINLTVYYFNETQVTGFNQTDFEQLMNQHNNKPFQNDCPLIQSDIILCRFNQKTKQNQIIKSSQIQGSNLILVVLVETNNIIEQYDNNLQLINQSQIQVSQSILIYLVVYPIGIIFLSNILIYMLFRQFNQLLNLINQKVYSNRKDLALAQFQQENQFFKSCAVTELIEACIRKFHNLESYGKSTTCIIQENLNYPKYTHTQMKFQQNLVLIMKISNLKLINEQETKNTIFNNINNFRGKQKL
ncbi:unnamed protein product [Paramecium octaurelia]|uniref:Uncharacterized protein n=1 Tax=Paramecium octaurelia TaxID=43137 RepID=A0A8S1WPG7_PAROT|nr:unnamed protein product [Paramecium octaurelia]